MGFRVPHVHCHFYPQYDDDDPFRPIDVTDGNVRLDDAAWEKRIADMRARLGRG
jgi:diadenosine tetraphosphate (Ap4A) HIT family hydrolase